MDIAKEQVPVNIEDPIRRVTLSMFRTGCIILFILCATARCFSSDTTIPQKIQKSATLLESGDLQGASALLKEVLQQNPEHGPAHLLMGQISLAQSQWSEAEEHLQKATQLQTRRPHLAWHLLGKLYLFRHDYTKAREDLDKALNASADFQPALIDRARASIFLNDTEKAIRDLQAAQESPEAKLLLEQLYFYLNRVPEVAPAWLQKSKEELTRDLSNNLSNDAAYFALGVGYTRDKEPEKAEPLFEISFQLNDQNPVAWLYVKDKGKATPQLAHTQIVQKIAQITAFLQQNNFAAAKQSGLDLVAGCPMCIPGHIAVAEASEKLGDMWKSLEEQQLILGWLRDVASLHARRANTARELGAYQLAECSVRKALMLEPKNGSHYLLLAKIQQAQKKTDDAIESCKKSLALGSENAVVYITLGDLYYEKMALSESIAALGKGIELDPMAAENIAQFALAALTTEDYSKLRSVLEKHAETHPENVNTLYSLATMNLSENRLDKARAYLLQLEKIAPDQSEVYYNLALLFGREGKQAEADRALKRFQELKVKEQQEWEKHNEAHRTQLKAKDLAEQNKIKEALDMYSKLMNSELEQNADLLAVAQLYLASAQYQKGEEVLQRLLHKSPADAEALTLMVSVAEKMGAQEVAREYRKRLALMSPDQLCK
jgi:Tfp pilus assembly protein PilF